MSALTTLPHKERSGFAATLTDRLDGLCLLGLGGFMAALALSNLYWYFLNPKFSHLTLAAGVILCVAGLALLFAPRTGRASLGRLLRQAALLIFHALAASSWRQAAQEPAPGAFDPAPEADAVQTPEPEAPVDLHPVKNGTAYVRLNLAELYIMLDKKRKDYPPHFALRAKVLRTPELNERGLVLLRRTAVVCCLADSLELRFFASGVDSALSGVQSGEWVEIFGHLEPLTAPLAETPADPQAPAKPAAQNQAKATPKADKAAVKKLLQLAPKGEPPSLAFNNPGFRIQADSVERIKEPAFPYLFEFREKEPFAW